MTEAHLSPTALTRFLGCEHRTYLDILEKRGEAPGERKPPRMQLLFDRGDRFEAGVVEDLSASGHAVTALEDKDATIEERAQRTLDAMRRGAPILHQACVTNGAWVGYPDFLMRVETPSTLGDWSYEAHDAKLTSQPRPSHIFQLLFYTDELARLQGVRPQRMHLILGDGRRPSFDPTDFDAYAAVVREQFVGRYAELAGAEPDPVYPYRAGACEFCHWWHICEKRRRDHDHMSLVAGLFRRQGLKLEPHGVHTVEDVAAIPEDLVVPCLPKDSVASLRAQASLQVRSRGLDRPLHEVREPEVDRGLHRLPEPSDGDVFFDFEGDQYWGDEGLEYLFGTVYRDGGEWRYWPLWATTRAQERAAFETWMDWITARLAHHPDLHIFHYNSYETVALKRLMALHGSREFELDELLRRRVFVDLYGITRQAIRAGTEGYGLKALEPVFGFERDAELRGAVGSMARWQAFQETGEREHLDGIAGYNEDDCHSTRALYDWLLGRRPEAEAQWGLTLDSLQPEPATELKERARKVAERTETMRPRLLDGLPDDESLDTDEERARRVAFGLLGYHSREAKPGWWEFFARRETPLDQLRDEDGDALAGLEVVSHEQVKQSIVWTLTYPAQEHKIGPGEADNPVAERSVNVVSVDEAARRVVVSIGKKSGGETPPVAIAPRGPFMTEAQEDALFRFAERIADGGLDRAEAGVDLLLRRPPRFAAGTPPLADGPVELDRLSEQVRGLDRSALVVQGPPGTGKTFTGARLALDLIGQDRKVGVVATSHKAIDNFLTEVEEAADETGASFRGWKKATGDNAYESDHVTSSRSRPSDEDGPLDLIAGTAWLWAREEMEAAVDVLFVDEAGQMSLADAIAAAGGARSVVLLGDPQQLAHVSQGTHPLGCGRSVLEHLLGDAQTVPRDRGVFLGTTWRMHPDVCAFVSRAMYDDSLSAVDGCERQRIDSPGMSGSGLRLLGVEHADNRGRSEEEADRIASEVAKLLDSGTYVDRAGERRPLTLDEILIVAPYNAQVRCLHAKLPEGARIGTVDKFQGQQAPVVLFSMASSSGDDVSRGMNFLFSRNRLNVAVSRAQALAVVVCSPRLMGARCSTVEDMRLVNMLCRFAGEAG